MKSERAWAGIICGFFLFIVVCLSLLLHMKGAFRATGNPELGCCSFCYPVRRQAASPRVSGCCVRLSALCWLRLFVWSSCGYSSSLNDLSGRNWRGYLARCSGARWARCAFYLFAPGLIPDASPRQRSESSQANRPRFSFAQASKSVQPPICF